MGIGADDPQCRPQPSSVNVFLAAAAAGTIATLATHPFDTIKTRLQVAASDGTNVAGSQVTVKSVVREMRLSIFYRGLGLRLMTIIPGTTVWLTTYSYMKRSLGQAA